MSEDRIKEILGKPFSELNEDAWKELQDLISAQAEAEEGEEGEKKEGEEPKETPPAE